MSFGLLNSAMLLGLAGLALPVLVHLLSRRNFDVVHWGAMQFLELSRKTKRRIRIEEFLLMLLRMGVVGLLVLALSRPWLAGGLLARFAARQTRDVVFVIDGSYSMGWEGRALTPHAAAIQWALRLVDGMQPGDTVALLDARDHVQSVIETPTHDFGLARDRLNGLPPPSGSSDLLGAVTEAMRISSRSGNLSRDIIVLTDGQARGWSITDSGRWEVLDDLRDQASIKPHIWVVDVMDHGPDDWTNFSLEKLEPSREFTAVNLPVRVKTKLRYTGGKSPIQRKVYLEVNGQRLADATLQTPLLQPGGEFGVEFEHRFTSVGSHLISAMIDPDNLSGDNRADAVIIVSAALPVVLVDGDPQFDPTRSETFFAQAALNATENETPLVRARVVDAEHFTLPDPLGPRVVVLANVPRLTPAAADALAGYVAGGGGLLIAPGNKVDAKVYNTLLFGSGAGLLAARLDSIQQLKADDVLGLRILDASLATPLVTPFRRERDGGLTEARFSNWWKMLPAEVPIARPAPSDAKPESPEKAAKPSDAANEMPVASSPVTAMRFDTGDPALLLGGYGRGHVALLAFPLDSDWSTLPAKPDYVPLLHELLFHLAGGADPSRNVQIGEPLLLPVAADIAVKEYVFRGPAGLQGPPELASDAQPPVISFRDTRLPGIYTLAPLKGADGPGTFREQFVVNFDRAESDLTPLDEKALQFLTRNNRAQFIKNEGEMQQQTASDGPKSEVWRYLIVFLLLLLVFELCMTHRLVRGGHAPDGL